MFTLRYVESGVEKTHALRAGQTLIGRLPTSDLMLNESSVSRQHTWIRVSDKRCFLRDAGSRYGTFRAGVKVEGEVELVPGDLVEVGTVSLTLEESSPEHVVLSENHQLYEKPGTLFRRLVVEDRRITVDRRTDDRGRPVPERRSGRDRRGGRLVRLLSEIGKTLVTIQPLSDVLNRVVDLVFTVVPSERAFLMLRESADQALTARVMRHRDGSIPESPTLSRTVVNRVMREKVAIQAFDATTDTALGLADSILALNIRSFMCAPLWNRQEVIGVLYADNPRTKRFTPDDLDVFTALANYAAVAIEQARLSEQLLDETRRRERLQRYHSPAVVNRILRSSADHGERMEAQERDVTVMICDLVGFTTICERMKPPDVATMLNTFFAHMTDVIFEHEGTLDKFMGDALLAVFGAPFEQPEHPLRAVQAALEMRRTLATLNEKRPDLRLEMRIAINSGVALTGDIGSLKRREFTVLGDVVNIASRIESEVAKPGQIVMSNTTWERVKDKVTATRIGSVALRGRTGSIDVFEAEG